MKKLLLASFLIFSSQAFAVEYTDWGEITTYTTGFSANQVRVELTAPFVSQNCSTSDGYMTDPADPGNQAHQAALLAAFVSGKQVRLALSGCTNVNRAKIVGVFLKK